MSGGYACRTIEDTENGGFHADVRGLTAALGQPSEPPPSSGRSEIDTQPYADAYADTMASPPAPAALTDDDPSWCVDTGSVMLTLTTFALWEALERGEVLAWMRVWREGMECWTPVGEIAELACALADAPAPEPDTLPSAEPPPSAAHTPGPMAADTKAPPPASGIRPVTPATLPRRNGRWVAVGSAVAIGAVISAIFVHERPPAPPPATPAGAALTRSEPAAPTEPADPLFRSPLPATATATATADEPIAPEVVSRHDERGQRRLPRGGRRAYGR